MTREEAIRHIRDVIAENNSIKPNIVTFEQEKEALYMAIEALSADTVATIQTGQTHGKSAYIKELAEVVRCKDCKHRSDGGWCDVYIQPRMDTDFCNHGERYSNMGERKGGED